jgi:hypothetical protein
MPIILNYFSVEDKNETISVKSGADYIDFLLQCSIIMGFKNLNTSHTQQNGRQHALLSQVMIDLIHKCKIFIEIMKLAFCQNHNYKYQTQTKNFRNKFKAVRRSIQTYHTKLHV